MKGELSSIDVYDELRFTPLLSAILIGDFDAIESLLKQGADPNKPQRDDPSATPRWHAEGDFRLHEIVGLRNRYGAKFDLRSYDLRQGGQTANRFLN